MNETFLNYRSYRWLWINIAISVVLMLWYLLDVPAGGRSGSTMYGYTVGVISAVAVFYLLWFAIRKRSHRSARTTLKGCLSAHVWTGLFVALWVALHADFRMHWNIHSLAYIFLLLVVITGVWGVYLYRALPAEIASNRGGPSLSVLKASCAEAAKEIEALATPERPGLQRLARELRRPAPPLRIFRDILAEPLDRVKAQQCLRSLAAHEEEAGLKLIGLIDKECDAFRKLARESRILGQLKVWLYIHVPVSAGLAAALIIHIVSVFAY